MNTQYETTIINTSIIDGTGKKAFKGDIGIKNERIAAVGNINGKGKKEIDGTGLITCPGFIDVHSHIDMTICKHPEVFNLIMQGITTFAGGNCGLSIAPVTNAKNFAETMKIFSRQQPCFEYDDSLESFDTFDKWLNFIAKKGISANYIPLVGFNFIRFDILGADYRRESTVDEIEKMKTLVEEAFKSGAFGISAQLEPNNSSFHASRHELVEVVKIAKKYNGYFTPHTRHMQNNWAVDNIENEGYGRFCGYNGEIITGRYHGLLEAVEICKDAGNARLNIAHLPPAYIIPQPHPVELDKAVAEATLEEIVNKAEREGLEISYDFIPSEYTIGSETYIIDEFLNKPPWRESMSRDEFAKKLKDKDFRNSISNTIRSGEFKFGMMLPASDPYWFDCYKIMRCKNKKLENKLLGEIIREKYNNNIINMVYVESLNIIYDILLDDPNSTWALIKDKRLYGALETFLKHPFGIPSTDILLSLPSKSSKDINEYNYGLSPLYYGMFVHYLRTMVKEKKVLTLEEAIRKITSFPAKKVFGITDRGVIQEGAYADIVIMDFEKLRENEDFKNPNRAPEGIEFVLVNGELACEKSTHTGIKAGKVLRNK